MKEREEAAKLIKTFDKPNIIGHHNLSNTFGLLHSSNYLVRIVFKSITFKKIDWK